MNYNKLPREYGKWVELKDAPDINALEGWESPVTIVTENILNAVADVNEAMDGKVMEAIVKVGIEVNKDELVKAMQYDRDQYEKGYRNGYNASYTADKWISVEDRLPENGKKVLVFFAGDYLIITSNDMWFNHWRKSATHWMPLSKPPKLKGV